MIEGPSAGDRPARCVMSGYLMAKSGTFWIGWFALKRL
jgi:hypothetical protein